VNWDIGIMEKWNDGFGKDKIEEVSPKLSLSQHSPIPTFQQ
jgi:hypothetical protein